MPFAFGVLWKMNGFVLVDISGKEVVREKGKRRLILLSTRSYGPLVMVIKAIQGPVCWCFYSSIQGSPLWKG